MVKYLFNDGLRPCLSICVVMRQEHKPDTQIGVVEECVPQFGDFAAKDLVRNLGHYS